MCLNFSDFSQAFNLVPKETHVYFGFALLYALCLVKNLRHVLDQSEVKPKQTVVGGSHKFCRASRQSKMFSLNFLDLL